MLEQITHDAFAQQLNTPFRVQSNHDRSLTVELIEATGLHTSDRCEAFSIVFRGPADPFLPQGTYRFDHDEIGAFELFIVPIRQDERGLYYEACFNRLRQGE